MKILLIYTEEEKILAKELTLLLENIGFHSHAFPILSTEESGKNSEKELISILSPSASKDGEDLNVIVLSALNYRLVYFLTGFSCASQTPFLVYGKNASECIPEEFSFCFKLFTTVPDLKKYLENEYAAYLRRDADKGTLEARENLLKMGIPVNEKSLVHCVEEGQALEVLFFLAAGFSPNTKSRTGVPLINISARKGNREIIRFLYSAGAEVNLQADDRGTSALIDSVMAKHFDFMMDLIKLGADLNIQSKDGQTALIVAVGAGEDKMVEALLKAGADPDIKDSMGVSARKYAALFKKSEVVSLFDNYVPVEAV